MKHLFVPYTLALLAENKGFGEECLAYYDNKILKLVTEKGKCDITAPLYQQLVDWFREKHNIYVWLQMDLVWNPDLDKYEDNIECAFIYKKGDVGTSSWSHIPNLLDVAIEEAFKLI